MHNGSSKWTNCNFGQFEMLHSEGDPNDGYAKKHTKKSMRDGDPNPSAE
jgi:hypothetical protein